MTDQKNNSLKLKILYFVCAILILISLAITILYLKTADISETELGPSPFNVDESYISENNLEYQAILELGKEINGSAEFEEAGYLGYILYEPEKATLILQEYLEKNKGIIEKADYELFKKCKFPKWNFNEDNPALGISYFQRLLKLMLYRINYYILIKNFDGAIRDLIILNNIGDELTLKSHTSLSLMVFLSIKSGVVGSFCDLINHPDLKDEHKLGILNIKINPITSQALKNTFHFEIKNVQELIKSIDDPNSFISKEMKNNSNYPLFSSFYFQPNKSVRLYREIALNIITQYETATHDSLKKINQKGKNNHQTIEFFEGNYGGIKLVESSASVSKIIAYKLMSFNNSCNQILIAKKLLEFKINTGELPTSLSDLKVDTKLYTDIFTGNPFLYFHENGILQSIGKDNENANLNLTTKKLPPDEIYKIINGSRDNILYIK